MNKMIRPNVCIFNKSWSTFQVCEIIGIALAVGLAGCLAIYLGLSLMVLAAWVVTSIATLFVLAMITKCIIGEEHLTYYHYLIAVTIVTYILVWLLHQPILQYLDIAVLCMGVVGASARVGCLMVGCCFGRPHHWGICYRKEHSDAGFPYYLVGVRLFPVQAVESLFIFLIVLVGVALVLEGSKPGAALAWFFIAYGLNRFVLEFLRGDPERPSFRGFSEAQWTSLIVVSLVVTAEILGALDLHPSHFGGFVLLCLAMIGVVLWRNYFKMTKPSIFDPRNVREVAEAVEILSNPIKEMQNTFKSGSAPENIQLVCTSTGIQISNTKTANERGCIYYYGLSLKNEVMTEETAKDLADLIIQLKEPSGSIELIKGSCGVFHLIIQYPNPC